jgi:starvation-inducible DNA-binding protein
MVTRTYEIYGETARRAATEIKPILADLIALGLQGKQLHWNVQGPSFKSIHEALDDIVDDARSYADLVAERMITLGVPPDGQPGDIATDSTFQPLPQGKIMDRDAIRFTCERLESVAITGRRMIDALDDLDLVTQDIMLDIVRGLEKHLWMLRSHEA